MRAFLPPEGLGCLKATPLLLVLVLAPEDFDQGAVLAGERDFPGGGGGDEGGVSEGPARAEGGPLREEGKFSESFCD